MTMDSDATQLSPGEVATGSGHGAAKIQRSIIHKVFVGPNGIRAGWRLLLFLVFFFAISNAIGFSLRRIPAIHAWRVAQDPNVLTAPGTIYREGIGLLAVLLAMLLMALIEKRSLADYSLAPKEAFAKRFWQGSLYGFAMISLLMAVIAAFHGFSWGSVALSSADAVKYGLLYGVGFILVGMFEEFSFRGYLQSTLGSGIGFWPAAMLLSMLFGALHLQNDGEGRFGALMVVFFGLFTAFLLKRTGNIWFPVGMHAAWDWGQTYFYSTPDSGFLAKGHLLNSAFHGPAWITGGAVGPEGSAFVLVVLLVGAIGIHFLFPAERTSYAAPLSRVGDRVRA